jgi:iron-sulfur cluster assembly protein
MRPACKSRNARKPEVNGAHGVARPTGQDETYRYLVGRAVLCTPGSRVFDLDTSQPYFSAMLNVTDNAVRQLQNLLSQRPENSQKGLRVEVAKGGCSGLHYEMTLGEREEGDAIVSRDGVQFFIDDDSVSYLRGATLDFTEGLTGTGFRIVNPNASRTCGCGSSFEASHSA